MTPVLAYYQQHKWHFHHEYVCLHWRLQISNHHVDDQSQISKMGCDCALKNLFIVEPEFDCSMRVNPEAFSHNWMERGPKDPKVRCWRLSLILNLSTLYLAFGSLSFHPNESLIREFIKALKPFNSPKYFYFHFLANTCPFLSVILESLRSTENQVWWGCQFFLVTPWICQ